MGKSPFEDTPTGTDIQDTLFYGLPTPNPGIGNNVHTPCVRFELPCYNDALDRNLEVLGGHQTGVQYERQVICATVNIRPGTTGIITFHFPIAAHERFSLLYSRFGSLGTWLGNSKSSNFFEAELSTS